ncbi:KH domain-containing protein [Periweissella cryptocerci]|uniref:KH domain-containing protein n=1 Tax=Periweissella cryptocerci TaxID=2506420 RepID=A0A4P6YW88_9LACO|nr:KH domain-containing protein [Periweissella cryptocerci]QBO37046.1 KH domain-containing protein [Periweissella cryptocerci]
MNEQEMKNLITTLIVPLASKPEVIEIEINEGDRFVEFTAYVDRSDLGRLIGVGGVTVTAIRNLVYSARFEGAKRVRLSIEPRHA